jgi:cellobiose phosphorylase
MQSVSTYWQDWISRQVRGRKTAGEPPLRAELFSLEQLARHAKALASGTRSVVQSGANSLIEQLGRNERELRAFNRATFGVDPRRRITPAAEWLLDNFYLIEEQIQMARRHLPRGYSRELPQLAEGPYAGLPRVYGIVLELISHVDAQIDLAPLSTFISAYQSVECLKLGELWAIPIMLRLGLIEDLQRVTTRLAVARQDRDLADLWVDRLQLVVEDNPSRLVIAVADMARSDIPVTSSFVAEFSQRLARQSSALHLARSWLDQRLAEEGLTVGQLVQQESQGQAADQVSVSHCISSFRLLSATDWRDFVEGLSAVEKVLHSDPAGVYGSMDFATRDRYRHSVEFLSRHSGVAEREVASRAVLLAAGAAQVAGCNDRTAHVGFYLIDKGQSALGTSVAVRWPWQRAIERGIHRFPLAFYAGAIGTLTALVTAGAVGLEQAPGEAPWRLILLALVFALCASQLSVALVNWLSMLLVRPRLLPRIGFSSGIAPECAAMVVVPTILSSTEAVDRLIETLEIHHLSNRDDRLHFALLTDFRDAATEELPGDGALLGRARAGIEMLNRKYLSAAQDKFYLIHRPRLWNDGEGLWMGHERKRGKLFEFNGLLRGVGRENFSEIVGDQGIFQSIKYVITLDTDTQLPRDVARQLVGSMAHPLNRPVFDTARRVVSEGYGILQPRIGVSLPGARRSLFVRLFAGEAGIDPYTREVSDVYQDVFQEGSFIGKGIYDVDAFQEALSGRFPENTVLSHDLLEACHARSALVSDVEFYEEYPSRYNVDIDRRHRWIRGDWQITQWLLPRVPGPDARRIENPLSALSQWKILDNLRRSLVPVALVLLLLGGWLSRPTLGGLASLLVLAVLALPGILAGLVDLIRKPDDLPLEIHLGSVGRSYLRQLGQVALTLAFLPYDAFISVDAVSRTLVRLLITRKRLLEWRTSSDAEEALREGLAGFVASMWISPALALAAAAALVLWRPDQWPFASPILALWLAAPWIAWWISQPIEESAPDLTAEQRAFLGRTSRATWHFFETFVCDAEHWLPPDNFQEVPSPRIASRTSPTNMGLALLANLAARDLGYLSAGAMLARTQKTLEAMEGLERHRGHFFNWYDTRTLKPLPPLYVSSVDSGNLAGHLLTLGAGLRELPDEGILPSRAFSGMRDTVGVLRGLIGNSPALARLDASFSREPTGLGAAASVLEGAADQARAIADSEAGGSEPARSWARALEQGCREHLEDLRLLAPWLALSPAERLGNPGGPVPGSDKTLAKLDRIPTLRDVAELDRGPGIPAGADAIGPGLARSLQEAGGRARARMQVLECLAAKSDQLAAMDFSLLFNRERNLFCTGYNVADRRFDTGFYDLLASEARLCSYVAIAQGQVPQDHWFSLSRLLVVSRGEPVLVSWSGSMFEYLMPLLVMPNYENTLLDHTCRAAVRQQIEYAHSRGLPWGISESGYNRTDVDMNYQYRAFGVPGLGLKRGLADDVVIAPYATAIALMVDPVEACRNLQRLADEGRYGTYGFYEAVDYTPGRLPPDETSVTIRSFMVHHQGMSLLSLDNFLQDGPMQRRFMGCPLLRSASLLLQERLPKAAASMMEEDLALEDTRPFAAEANGSVRTFTTPNSPSPEVHLLSNGRYHVAVTSAGGGYSRWRDIAVTRWREDPTLDSWGAFIYVRDLGTGHFWSAAHQPTRCAAKGYEAIFSTARAEFRQSQGGLDLHTDVCVSPEDDVELRRVTITNRSSVARVIEVTSYAEVVLAAPGADAAHPAFSNLFVQTEFIQKASAVLCTRRARSLEENPPWLVHLMVLQGEEVGVTSCETDRLRFLGRGRSLADPEAMELREPLSNTVGSVLDPVVSLRRAVSLGPDETAVFDVVLGVAGSRGEVLAQLEKYQGYRMADRAFDLAWTHSQVTLRQLDATEAEAQVYGRLASALIYADPARRAPKALQATNRRSQSGLWSFGISGDVPLVVLRIGGVEQVEIVRQLVKAHSYWRVKGLVAEMLILVEDLSIYRQSLHDRIADLVRAGVDSLSQDKPGGIFVRNLDQVSNEDLALLQASARAFIDSGNGSLADQLDQRRVREPLVPAFVPTRSARPDPSPPIPTRELIFKNGLGGFTKDGHEYVITLQAGEATPAPWVNVIANPSFGTVVSESGSAYTWSENSHEFRLTPWNDDPVRDTTGETLYLRDEHTGQVWSPTPQPASGVTPYVIRHGFGYTVFEHTENGIASELWVYVAMDSPVKFSTLKLRNISGRPRNVTVTGYWEWVLGEQRKGNLLHVRTEMDPKTGALLARNSYNIDFPDRVVFVDAGDGARGVTGDRREFLGRNGGLSRPAALRRARLSGRVGAGLDPCGAVQVALDLPEGEEREVCFRLGVGRNLADAQALVQRFRRADSSREGLEGVWAYWNRTLGAVNVDTPDPAVNVLANGWLMYQTISGRLWGRTGFYQSGGAYGFRDQLQDVMALVHAEPALTREQLVRAAAHQYVEGDVQHWWHPPSGRGVRTHFSDDLLWLPYAICRYVECVADTGVLGEKVAFLKGRPVRADEESYYEKPEASDAVGTLYEHGVRAIERGLKLGAHGLPLMGCGDWNDGMNRVGNRGRGESVWLAFFLHGVLTRYAPLARSHGDPAFADRCLAEAQRLQASIEANAWDGAWYRRAYFDSGEPLGSKLNAECQIDSLPQSWSVISGAGEESRSRQAMRSMDQRLVNRGLGLIQLLTPPFDTSPLDPGYIRGYIPGVRENGGQYTQAAIWCAMALAQMGDGERAWEYFGMLNPVHHSSTPAQVAVYKVEPYVMAADIYSVSPHQGRGGWTWYTGSAGWMYRLLIESLLGVNLEGDKLRLAPLMPAAWSAFKVHYRYRETTYHISILRRAAGPTSTQRLFLDGQAIEGAELTLSDDRREHTVEWVAP